MAVKKLYGAFHFFLPLDYGLRFQYCDTVLELILRFSPTTGLKMILKCGFTKYLSSVKLKPLEINDKLLAITSTGEAERYSDINGTKSLEEAGMKLPKTMKGMFISLLEDQPQLLRGLKAYGYILTG
ncbi:hypothetical protein BDC45DRAFT_560081 [Circinella umbellata]|nr:hypothetical protein BDC45DRAFT_560081 [Circinella umbellata]